MGKATRRSTRTRKANKKKKKESESEAESEEESESPIDGVLNGLIFSVQCTGSKKRQERVESNGGKVKSVSKQTHYLVVNAKDANLATTKCKRAKELKIPIVTDLFIEMCIKNDKVVDHKKYQKQYRQKQEEEEKEESEHENDDDN